MLNERIGIPATTTAAVNKLIEAHERGELAGVAVVTVTRTAGKGGSPDTSTWPEFWFGDPMAMALIVNDLGVMRGQIEMTQIVERRQRAEMARLQAEAQAKAAEEAAAKPNRKTRRAAARKRR